MDDILRHILIHLDLKNLHVWSQTSHHIYQLLLSKYFWVNKMENDNLNNHIIFGYPL